MKRVIRYGKSVYVIFAFSCIFAGGAWCYPLFRTPEVVIPAITRGPQAQMPVLREEQVKPLSFYAQALEKKNIFGALFVEKTPSARAPGADEILKPIVLLGVISGIDPQAVIEDTKKQKTYFLRPGESVDDRITLERIEQGKVFLRVEGGTYELHL